MEINIQDMDAMQILVQMSGSKLKGDDLYFASFASLFCHVIVLAAREGLLIVSAHQPGGNSSL